MANSCSTMGSSAGSAPKCLRSRRSSAGSGLDLDAVFFFGGMGASRQQVRHGDHGPSFLPQHHPTRTSAVNLGRLLTSAAPPAAPRPPSARSPAPPAAAAVPSGTPP